MTNKKLSCCMALAVLLLASCNSSGNGNSGTDSAGVPSALDTMKTPVHPGMVDSTGAPRLRQ